MAAEVADLSEDMRLIMDEGVKRLTARMADLIVQGQKRARLLLYNRHRVLHRSFIRCFGCSIAQQTAQRKDASLSGA